MILQTGLKFLHIFEVLNFRIILPKSLKTISRHLSKSNMWIKSPKLSKALFNKCWTKKDEQNIQDRICDILDLNRVRDRSLADLSGGELQRFACAMVCIQKADTAIRNLIEATKYVIVVEHDLAVLDYLSD